MKIPTGMSNPEFIKLSVPSPKEILEHNNNFTSENNTKLLEYISINKNGIIKECNIITSSMVKYSEGVKISEDLIPEVKLLNETILKIKELKSLYKKYRKKNKIVNFSIKRDFNIGTLFNLGLTKSDEIILDPRKSEDYIEINLPLENVKPLAEISFRYYPRNKIMVKKFTQIKQILRSNKVDYDISINNIKGNSYITIKCLDARHNLKFWNNIHLWSKKIMG